MSQKSCSSRQFLLNTGVTELAWNMETTMKHVVLDAHLRELLSDERKLWQVIERLLSLSVIHLEEHCTVTIGLPVAMI